MHIGKISNSSKTDKKLCNMYLTHFVDWGKRVFVFIQVAIVCLYLPAGVFVCVFDQFCFSCVCQCIAIVPWCHFQQGSWPLIMVHSTSQQSHSRHCHLSHHSYHYHQKSFIVTIIKFTTKSEFALGQDSLQHQSEYLYSHSAKMRSKNDWIP